MFCIEKAHWLCCGKSLCRKTSLIRPHGGHGACSPMRPLNHKTGTTGVPCSGPMMHGHGVTNAKLLLLNLLLDQLPKGLHRLAWICVASDVVVGTFQEVNLILALVLCGIPYLRFELEQRSSFCCFFVHFSKISFWPWSSSLKYGKVSAHFSSNAFTSCSMDNNGT